MENESLIMKEMKLRKKYNDEFYPLMSEKKYDEALAYLGENPKVEDYLAHSDERTLRKYLQSKLEEMFGVEVSSAKIPWDIGDDE